MGRGLVGPRSLFAPIPGSPRRDVARSLMPARQEPRVDPEPHGGAPPGGGPDRIRPQPSQLLEAGERALDDPGLRQARPRVPVHVPGRERAGQPPVRELGRQQRGRHPRPVGYARVEAPRVPLQILLRRAGRAERRGEHHACPRRTGDELTPAVQLRVQLHDDPEPDSKCRRCPAALRR
jgi:hypothetical protein